ncbi:MAG: zf-HC2 domain-containing protein [Bacteroidota bacterium]
MKKCNEQKIWDYIDGELNPEEIKAIREHFKNCPKCLEEFEINLSLHLEIKKMDCMKPSIRFGKNIMEAIELDVSKQFKPLLNVFWKRICIGGFGTVAFYAIIIAIFYPHVFAEPNTPKVFSLWSLFNHPATTTVLGVFVTAWILYFADHWMQKRFKPEPAR